MIKTFTQNDLIRYLYHETSEQEEREINKALLCDSVLQDQFKELNIAKQSVEAAHFQPSAEVVLNVLSYSRSLNKSV